MHQRQWHFFVEAVCKLSNHSSQNSAAQPKHKQIYSLIIYSRKQYHHTWIKFKNCDWYLTISFAWVSEAFSSSSSLKLRRLTLLGSVLSQLSSPPFPFPAWIAIKRLYSGASVCWDLLSASSSSISSSDSSSYGKKLVSAPLLDKKTDKWKPNYIASWKK